MTACTTHEALHAIFDDPPEYGVPYDDETDVVPIGTAAPHKLTAGVSSFDGWGYMSLYDADPPAGCNPELAECKLPLLDTYAIPEALNPAYAIGFGDLSIHEQAADPTEPLSYAAYYAGGMRVFSVAGGQIAEVGSFIDTGGNNFWGVEQFTQGGERYIAGSDRDFGLYLFRYTGPGAAKRPACSNVVAAVPFKGTAAVPLPCADANGNALTRSVTSPPAKGTLAAVDQAAGAVTYSHTGDVLGTDQLTFTASDGAAEAATATAEIVIGATSGGPCFNQILGTAASETLAGSEFGDEIRGEAGNDVASGLAGADCISGASGRDRIGGGTGADRLRGGSGRDRVSGGVGRDRLHGRSGGDRLDGGPGRNRVIGGRGNDRIRALNGVRDRINCGRGVDTVRADDNDRVSANCENVSRS